MTEQASEESVYEVWKRNHIINDRRFDELVDTLELDNRDADPEKILIHMPERLDKLPQVTSMQEHHLQNPWTKNIEIIAASLKNYKISRGAL